MATGAVLGRRPALHHRHGDAGALQPLRTFRFLDSVAPGERRLDQVEALRDAVTAEARIARLLPDRLDIVAGPHHVAAPKRDGIETEFVGEIVDRAFNGEGRL